MEIGTKVRMVNCYEARLNDGKIFTTRSEPWKLPHGEEVVKLDGKSGGFATKYLEVVEQ